jgi:hypothetical protein
LPINFSRTNIFRIEKFDHWPYLTTGGIFHSHAHFKTKWRTYKQRLRTDNVSDVTFSAPRSRHLRGRYARYELTFWICLVIWWIFLEVYSLHQTAISSFVLIRSQEPTNNHVKRFLFYIACRLTVFLENNQREESNTCPSRMIAAVTRVRLIRSSQTPTSVARTFFLHALLRHRYWGV